MIGQIQRNIFRWFALCLCLLAVPTYAGPPPASAQVFGLPGIVAPGWEISSQSAPNSWNLIQRSTDMRAALSWQSIDEEPLTAIIQRMTGKVPADQKQEAKELYFGAEVTRVTVPLELDAQARQDKHPDWLSLAFFEHDRKAYVLLVSGGPDVDYDKLYSQAVWLAGSLFYTK